jgi:hypothetical protein
MRDVQEHSEAEDEVGMRSFGSWQLLGCHVGTRFLEGFLNVGSTERHDDQFIDPRHVCVQASNRCVGGCLLSPCRRAWT